MCTFLVDVAGMVMDYCIRTKHAPHKQDYEITFDCSLFENNDSNRNKCYRGLPCTCVCDLVQNKCEASFFSGERFYDSFEKESHPLYLVVCLHLFSKLSECFIFLYCQAVSSKL